MSGSRFKIMDVTRKGYMFLRHEYRYLGRVCLLPLGATIILSLFLNHVFDKGAAVQSPFTYALLDLPANALMGWYLFILARLIFFGERLDALPKDPSQVSERRRLMQAGIIGFILLKMFQVTILSGITWLEKINMHEKSTLLSIVAMFLIGASIWCLRFIAAPLLLSLGYPVRGYIYRVNGVGISLRIIGLTFLSFLPIAIVVSLIMAIFLPDHLQSVAMQLKIFNALGPIASYAFCTLFFCSFGFALKEMLSPPQRRGR